MSCCAAKANLSWGGFIMLAVLLAVMSICFATLMAIIRMNQRRQLRTQEARDCLWKLLNPLVASSQQQRWVAGRGGARRDKE